MKNLHDLEFLLNSYMTRAPPDSSHHCGDRKIKVELFLFKKPNFISFQPKNISITPWKHLQTNSSTQNTKKRVQKPKIKFG